MVGSLLYKESQQGEERIKKGDFCKREVMN